MRFPHARAVPAACGSTIERVAAVSAAGSVGESASSSTLLRAKLLLVEHELTLLCLFRKLLLALHIRHAGKGALSESHSLGPPEPESA